MSANDSNLLRTSGVTLTAFGVANVMGTKTVLTLEWSESDKTSNLSLELTAEQCTDLSVRLFNQARILIMEQ